jgi:SulP family sulfate permease
LFVTHRYQLALARVLPITTAVAGIREPGRRRDLAAGLGVAAILVPQGMAYGELAGLQPVVGLYSALGAMVAFALVSRTRQLIVGPEATLAVISAATIGGLAHGDAARAVALSGMLALLIGGILVVAGLIRLGFIAEFLSRPVLLGYITGVALTVIASQLPKIFGFKVEGSDFFTITWNIVSNLGSTQVLTFALGVGLIVVSVILQRVAPRLPSALVVLVLGTAVSAIFDLRAHGVVVIGHVPSGLPRISVPTASLHDIRVLGTAAGAIALLAFADSIATARAFAAKHGEDVDANRESIALGLANVGAALTGGFASSASGSRSAVNDAAGARSQLSQLVGAVGVVIVLLFLTGLLTELPLAALAAVVIAAAARLFDFRELRELWRLWRSEALLAVVTLLGVTILGVLAGLGLAVVLALVNLVYRATNPHDAVLGQDERGFAFRDITRLDEPLVEKGLVIYRFDAPLFFANATYFRRRVLELVDHASEPVEGVLIDAGAIFYVDSTAIAMLQQLRQDLDDRGLWLATARMKTPVRQMLDRAGAADPIGERREFATVRDAVRWFHQREHPGTSADNWDGRAAGGSGGSAAARRTDGDAAIG